MFGLSKGKPLLDHHPKAHIHEIRRISRVKSISKDQLPGMVSPMFNLATILPKVTSSRQVDNLLRLNLVDTNVQNRHMTKALKRAYFINYPQCQLSTEWIQRWMVCSFTVFNTAQKSEFQNLIHQISESASCHS